MKFQWYVGILAIAVSTVSIADESYREDNPGPIRKAFRGVGSLIEDHPVISALGGVAAAYLGKYRLEVFEKDQRRKGHASRCGELSAHFMLGDDHRVPRYHFRRDIEKRIEPMEPNDFNHLAKLGEKEYGNLDTGRLKEILGQNNTATVVAYDADTKTPKGGIVYKYFPNSRELFIQYLMADPKSSDAAQTRAALLDHVLHNAAASSDGALVDGMWKVRTLIQGETPIRVRVSVDPNNEAQLALFESQGFHGIPSTDADGYPIILMERGVSAGSARPGDHPVSHSPERDPSEVYE